MRFSGLGLHAAVLRNRQLRCNLVVVLALALGRLGRRAGLLLLTAYAAYILQLG